MGLEIGTNPWWTFDLESALISKNGYELFHGVPAQWLPEGRWSATLGSHEESV